MQMKWYYFDCPYQKLGPDKKNLEKLTKNTRTSYGGRGEESFPKTRRHVEPSQPEQSETKLSLKVILLNERLEDLKTSGI